MLSNNQYLRQESDREKEGSFLLKSSPTAFRETVLNIDNICVNFGDLQALKNIHLEIFRGEILFVTGSSGAGKTTLMKLLGGFIKPSKGKLSVNLDKDALMAPIFQDLHLLENQSIEQNLFTSFDRKLYKSKSDFSEDLIDFAKVLGIYDRLNMKVKDANGGLKQKVAFLRAMLAKPDVLLADEPTSSLDYQNAKKMFDILSLYNTKQALTVIWATHNKDLIKRFNGRIIHLDQGKLIHSGHACFI